MKFLARFFAETAIQIRGGSARCAKGKMMSRLLSDIASLANDAGVTNGEIWIDQKGKVSFSHEIPSEYHQRMRNVIASY